MSKKEKSKYQEQLFKIIVAQAEKFDQKIILISGGAFTIASVFIEKVVNLKNALGKVNLLIALSLFAAATIIGLLSHFLSMQAHVWASNNYDEMDYDRFLSMRRIWNIIIHTLNYITLTMLILGSIFLLYFIKTNI